MTSFRHWAASATDNLTAAEVEATECFTALSFTAGGIRGQPFDLTGTDQLLFAGNGEDAFVQYHGAHRGSFSLAWTTGTVELLSAPPVDDEGHDEDHGSDAASSSSRRGGALWGQLATTLVLGIVYVAVI